MLRVIADGSELYLTVEVPGDYAELLHRVMRGQFLVEGTHNLLHFIPQFACH